MSGYKLSDLKQMARELQIGGYSKMKKADLVTAIENHPETQEILHKAQNTVPEKKSPPPADMDSLPLDDLEERLAALQKDLDARKAKKLGKVTPDATQAPRPMRKNGSKKNPWLAFQKQCTQDGKGRAVDRRDEYDAFKANWKCPEE